MLIGTLKSKNMKKVSIEFTIAPKIELVLKTSIDILICDINSNVMLLHNMAFYILLPINIKRVCKQFYRKHLEKRAQLLK